MKIISGMPVRVTPQLDSDPAQVTTEAKPKADAFGAPVARGAAPSMSASEWAAFAEQQRNAHPLESLFGVDSAVREIGREVAQLMDGFWQSTRVEPMRSRLDETLARYAPHLTAGQYLEVFEKAFSQVSVPYIEQYAGTEWGEKLIVLYETFAQRSQVISGEQLEPGALHRAHGAVDGGLWWGTDAKWFKDA